MGKHRVQEFSSRNVIALSKSKEKRSSRPVPCAGSGRLSTRDFLKRQVTAYLCATEDTNIVER